MKKKQIVVGRCESCGRDMRTRGTVLPVMKFTCKCGHANTIHADDSLLGPWREEQTKKEKNKNRQVIADQTRNRLRYVNPFNISILKYI